MEQASSFFRFAGGAPANVAVGIARLGTASAFCGKVGDDPFGKFLVSEMRSQGVDTSAIHFDPDRKTRLAFVSLMKGGDWDFQFWKSRPAEENYQGDHVDRKLKNGRTSLTLGLSY